MVIMRRTTLSPDPAGVAGRRAAAAARLASRSQPHRSVILQEETELYHARKSRFLLFSIPTLIAGVVVATGATGPDFGCRPALSCPLDPQDFTFSDPAAGTPAPASTSCYLITDKHQFWVVRQGRLAGSQWEFPSPTPEDKGADDIIGGAGLVYFNHYQYAWAPGTGSGNSRSTPTKKREQLMRILLGHAGEMSPEVGAVTKSRYSDSCLGGSPTCSARLQLRHARCRI
jgi:hypothetical protein